MHIFAIRDIFSGDWEKYICKTEIFLKAEKFPKT